jgi:hypothetical protein
MKKSVKDQTARAFQVGGYNPPSVPQQPYTQPTQVDPQTGTYVLPGTGIAGYQIPTGAPTGFTPYGGATPYFQPVQFTGAQYQTALQTTNLPTFAETVGQRAGQYDELRTYINDAGQTLQIPFKDGRPIYPIPEGYRPIGDQPEPEEEQVTVSPIVGETTVRDDGGGDRDSGYTVGGVTYGSFNEATEANANMLGATGRRGVDLAGVAAALGVPGAAMGIGKGATFGGTAPAPGTGTVGYGALAAVAGMSDDDYDRADMTSALTGAQAQARLDAIANVGVVPTGYIGYNPGDAVPGMPGAVMGVDGISRSLATGAVARDANGVPAYDNFQAFIDRVSMSKEEKDRADQESIDNAKSFNDALARDAKGQEAMTSKGGIGPGKGGIPDAPSAPSAPAAEAPGHPGMSDTQGFGTGQSSRGDPSDTGKGSGGHTGGSAADGSEAETGGGYGGLGH